MTTTIAPLTDSVPAPVRALATLFADALGAVVFPDVDAAALAGAVTRVDEQQAAVARLEDELAKARAALDAGREDLLRLATRAHAYARVYAEDDEALRGRVDEIALPRARSRTPAKVAPLARTDDDSQAAPAPRRKRKASDDEAPLFSEGPSSGAAA